MEDKRMVGMLMRVRQIRVDSIQDKAEHSENSFSMIFCKLKRKSAKYRATPPIIATIQVNLLMRGQSGRGNYVESGNTFIITLYLKQSSHIFYNIQHSRQQGMKFTNVKTISEYNTLLQNLNPWGKFQIRIYIICVLYWMIAGIYATSFELSYKSFQCPYALGAFQGLGILIFSWLSNIKGRKFSTISASIICFVGYIMCLVCTIQGKDSSVGTFGIAIMGLAIYSQPCQILGIVCELTTNKIINIILCLSLVFYCLGRISIILVINGIRNLCDTQNVDLQVTYSILAPLCLIALVMGMFIYDSPRYFIENNINKAEDLIKKIIEINTGQQKQIMANIDENFMLKRIHLRRYNYLTLVKYSSFGFAQYCTAVVMLLLGMVGRESKYIFAERSQMASPQIQIMWISCFELVGILASVFFLKFCGRRITCIVTSFLIAVVATVLYFMNEAEIYSNLVLLGLNAAFSIVHFIFLVINCIQFYPHSVRSFGLAMMLSLYYFGKLLFDIYWKYNSSSRDMLQLFLMGGWIMFLHCFGQQETLGKGLAYQIKEIEEEQNQDI